MNEKDKMPNSKPLSEVREGFDVEWDGPTIEISLEERVACLNELNESLEKTREDIRQGRGIPANIVMTKMRKRLEAKLKAQG